MSETLVPGTRLSTLFGGDIVVGKTLAEGGHGSSYIIDYNGEKKVLKWYEPYTLGQNPEAFYNNIKENILRKAPNKIFLWPLDITNWSNGTFGYVMDLRPDGYYKVTDYMLATVCFKNFRTMIDAALNIVSAFRILHNKGYSFIDMNDGNFFINPDTGRVLICDNDKVAPDGVETGILGKPRYMAPEIVVSGGEILPNTLTDRHSLSVILYSLICLNHPLIGERYLAATENTDKLQKIIFGTEPIFIMDPMDDRNRPDPQIQRNSLMIWNILPDYIKDIFLKSFSKDAFAVPSKRPRELDWFKVLTRFRSEIVECSCGNEVFTKDGHSMKCDRCGRIVNIPFHFELSDYNIPASNGTRLYRGQFGICNESEALRPVGVVLAKKKDSNVMALKNKSNQFWQSVIPSGEKKNIAPGEIILLRDDIKLNIYGEDIIIKKLNERF